MKFVIRIVVLLVVVLGVAWPMLPPEKRQLYTDIAQGRVDWRQLVIENPFGGQELRLSSVGHQINQGLKEAGVDTVFHLPVPTECEAVATQSITKVTKPSIYRWQDSEGRWHFSDAKQQTLPEQASDIGERYQSKAQYFTLQLHYDGDRLPAFVRDQIRADTQQIFKVLSAPLAKERLRQVALNVRVIDEQAEFQRQLAAVAPGLKTNSGFYTTQNNEAVVWRQPEDELLQRVIRHESTHVIVAGLLGYPPVWFNEGVAEYFEQMRLQGNSRQVHMNNDWLTYLNSGDSIDLEEYFQLNGREWRSGDQQHMYAIAWSVVAFLMSDDDGQALISAMTNYMADHKCEAFDSLAFINQYYRGGIQRFQQQWQAWLISPSFRHYY